MATGQKLFLNLVITSPCISICKTDPVTGFCYGCGRSDEDKKRWKSEDVSDEWKINNLKENVNQSLYPEIRIYENPSTITYETSIRSGILKDYYITMSNIDRSDYYNIKFQKKPFMMWIWISVIFISLGGFLRLYKNAKNNY